MSQITYVDKERAANFFGFSNGYIFTFLNNHNIPFNKTNTRNMILEACGIDIYKDSEYDMSQERCIRKLWDEADDYSVGCLFKVMLDYYAAVANWDWDWKEKEDYQYLRELEKRLCSAKSLQLPATDNESLSLLQKDIERNFSNNTPELALDRLHTFSTHFFRKLSRMHGLDIANTSGENFSLETLVANLKNFYRDNSYFSSDFCVIAIQNTINIFAKFNAIRNNQSFSHPNPILSKIESEYVVKVISDTLMFIDKIERQHDEIEVDELPF